MERESIYEFAGGQPAFDRLAAAHHELCLRDPELNHAFSHGGHPQHVARLASYLAEVFGGPATYSEQCGAQVHMMTLHAGNGIGDDWGDRFVRCFDQAVTEAQLPDNPELRRALNEYMQWAVGDVIEYSPPGSAVPQDLTVPRWSWNGRQIQA